VLTLINNTPGLSKFDSEHLELECLDDSHCPDATAAGAHEPDEFGAGHDVFVKKHSQEVLSNRHHHQQK